MGSRLSALICIVAASCLAQDGARPDVSRMDQVVQSYVNNKQFMGSVLVARGEDVLFGKSYGSANLEWNIPNTPATKFRIGSMTKQFTAASILLLEERGKLKVEDQVKKYMTDAPAAWDKITIFNVLTHTAGLPNFTSFPEYAKLQAFPNTPEQIVATFRDKPLDFEPGTKFSYSNSGYVLLGYLIEKISGESYEKFLQENIFTPLGMKDSGYDSNSSIIERRASGYAPSPAGPVNAEYVHMSVPHGAGALYSTTLDLLTWQLALYGGKVLKPESLAKMTTPFKDDYAFGLIVRTADGRKRMWHNGGIQGFNSSMAWYPESKTSVIVLANLNGQAADQILPQLAAVGFGKDVKLTSEHKEIKLPGETLASYVGIYQLAPKVKLTMTLDGGQMMTQLSGQQRLQVFPEADGKFFLKVVDAQLEFVKDANGKVTDVILHQNGRDQKAPRISDTVPEKKAITLRPETLAAYAGAYTAGPAPVTVAVKDDHLTMDVGPQKFELFADSETSFFVKEIDAEVEFLKGANGEITGLVSHLGPQDIQAARK
jgi:CubicO group peptidase (beta-lactamase class C family)